MLDVRIGALVALAASTAGSALAGAIGPVSVDAPLLFHQARQQAASPGPANDPAAAAPAAAPASAPASSLNATSYWPPPSMASDPGLWAPGFALAQPLVQNMTVEEKVAVVTGQPGPCVGYSGAVERLGLRSMCLQDGPLGVRPVRRVSQFPAGVTTAATWDRALMHARGKEMAEEFRDKGINMMLSPVAGSGPIGRSPLGGRNAEGFGQDEYLGGEAAYQTVVGAQSVGVMTCSKHYLLYEQETFRRPFGDDPTRPLPISATADSKTIHELYLWPFAEAVRAGTASVMCSYNRIDGIHSCEDSYMMNEVLKGELNFRAGVVSDWGGDWSNADAANGGLDMSMPGANSSGNGDFFGRHLTDSVNNGSVSMGRLDDMVYRVLAPWLTLQDQKTYPLPTFDVRDITVPTNNVRRDHWKLINKIGEESVTLLKNNRSAPGLGLPLPSIHELPNLLVAGSDAGANSRGWTSCGDFGGGCPVGSLGTLTAIGGSGWAYPPYIIDPLAAVQRYVREGATDINIALDDWDLSNAQTQAARSAASLVFVSAFTSEGSDRQNLTLQNNGDELVKAVAANCNNTIVVIHAPGAVLLEEWIDHPNVTAVLFAYYPGQEGGETLPPLLWGEKSPSGKLPFVIGKNISDYPPNGIMSDNPADPSVNFTEAKLIDWKWFQAQNITPRFDFGHGLSYSTFRWGQLSFDANYFRADNSSLHRTNERFQGSGPFDSVYDVIGRASVYIANKGKVRAAEVPQLYLSFPAGDSAGQPPKLLRGFEKVWLDPGEGQTVQFDVRRKDISVYDVDAGEWRVPSGAFTFSVGSSSESIHSTVQQTFD